MKKKPSANYRLGFTLVELLVVIAIIGVLVGLLLPAVQAAREAARRMSCSNNIAQIGLSTHNYEFAADHLPPGSTSPTGPIVNSEVGDAVGWMVRILPFIEQQNAFDDFDSTKSIYDPANLALRHYSIPTFRCPSSPHISTIDRYGLTDYFGCHHDSAAAIDDDNHGVLFLNSRVRYSEIRDGSAFTILVGEGIPSANGLGWCTGTEASLRNSSTLEGGAMVFDMPMINRDTTEVGGFGSQHPGGAQFLFADGSVRFLMNSIDPLVFSYYAHRSDGEVIQDDY